MDRDYAMATGLQYVAASRGYVTVRVHTGTLRFETEPSPPVTRRATRHGPNTSSVPHAEGEYGARRVALIRPQYGGRKRRLVGRIRIVLRFQAELAMRAVHLTVLAFYAIQKVARVKLDARFSRPHLYRAAPGSAPVPDSS